MADTTDTSAATPPTDSAATPPTDTAATPPTDTAPAEAPARPNRRKIREGLVASNGMQRTAVVHVVDRVRHPRYAKTLQRTTKLYVDDPQDELRVGDRVRVHETRPLSKLK